MKKVFYFSTPSCGPCKMFKPVMQQLAQEGHNIQFIDAISSPDLADQFNIRSVPAVVVLQGSQEVARFTGVKSKVEVENIIR